jgi:hypothetical protein
MKTKLCFLTTCLAALICIAPLAATAATKKSPAPGASPSVTPSPKPKSSPKTTASPSPTASPHPTAARAIPFHGKISAVDQKAKTFTIGHRVFKVTDKTVLTKAGAHATMKDVVANEEARGSYWKLAGGTLEAKTVKLGPKTDVEKKSEPSPSASPSASP